jgi:hypothetical protein
VALDRLLAAAACNSRGPLAQLGDELLHPLAAAIVLVRPLDVGLEDGHVRQRIAPPFDRYSPPRRFKVRAAGKQRREARTRR